MRRYDRLIDVMEKRTRRVIGLMSGTSVDAIDAALVEIEGSGAEAKARVVAFESYPFPAEIRARVFALFDPKRARVDQICNLDFLLGELFAEAVQRLLETHRISADDVDAIGTAGQTIWHDPEPIHEEIDADWVRPVIETRSTFAIGQSAVIAERTGIITVGDLRVRDVAAGGHGAPLIAYADWVLLRDETKGRCVQNIGGISNVSFLPAGCDITDVVAFDNGPGNMIIDALAEVATGGEEKFDRDGRIGREGTVDERLLSDWMADPYFKRRPPKTTGRERFGVQFARRILTTDAPGRPIEDLVATATALTARSIAQSYRDFLLPRGTIDEVIVGGGGARNPLLMEMIAAELPGIRLLTHEDVGIDSKAKEALGIAIIASDSLSGLPDNVPGATGGVPTILGKISL